MASDSELAMTEQLYRATGSPRGIALTTSDSTRTLALAYRTRSKLGDPSLSSLRFTKSPTEPNVIWLVRDDVRTDGLTTSEQSTTEP